MFEDKTLEVEDTSIPELFCSDGDIRAWRFEEFLRLGFVAGVALVLMDANADLGLARRLISLGCPHGTAQAILH